MSLRYTYSPPSKASRIDHVGTYRRALPVNLERMYENALDWAHLPHLHASSFSTIRCLDDGGWGWRCAVTDARGRESELELCLDRTCRRWITRNLSGHSQGAEIWTHVFVTQPRELEIVVDYFVPGVAPDEREKIGQAYARAYETLYDEDVWMMTERQREIDRRLDSIRDQDHISVAVPGPDQLPLTVELSGRRFLIDRLQDQWVVYPAACPHQLGPLGRVDDRGQVRCPWHGYTFDVVSGECVNHATCRLGRRPRIEQVDAALRLDWAGVSLR